MIEIAMPRTTRETNGKSHLLEPDLTDDRPWLADDRAEGLVGLFKLLSDETRLRILLALLRETEMNVRSLCEHLGQSQPAVSHHLALLRDNGLIDRRRDGKHNFYYLQSDQIEDVLRTVAPESNDREDSDSKLRVLSDA